VLAPTESGAQLIRLPKEVFVTRCLLTTGTTSAQCRAFYDKLWGLQIDARNLAQSAERTAKAADLLTRKKALMAEQAAIHLHTPFDKRMRAGMFVKVKQQGNEEEIVMVLAPEGAFFGRTDEQFGVDTGPFRRYACAKVVPGPLTNSHVLLVGEQKVVAVKDMTGQISLEYDAATRYYFLNI
jgi:kinesin family protein 2/24